MKVVLDASAVLAGVQPEKDHEYLITPQVVAEIKENNAFLKVELNIDEGNLRVKAPRDEYFNKVMEEAATIGEAESLSKPDISSVALAFELKEKGVNVVLATDDHGIQNLAEFLEINYVPITEEGIKRRLKWHFMCTGCGQEYGSNLIYCEICGSRVKRRPRKTHR